MMANASPMRNRVTDAPTNGHHQEELHENKFIAAETLSKVMGQYDLNRIKLTKEEHEHAVDIKEIVEGMPDLDNLPDFWYAQLAIVCKGNVDDAISRCYAMQEFRHEYKILDSFEQASRALRSHFELFPRQMLSFSFSEKDGTYVFVHDYAEFDPKKFTSAQMLDQWMVVMYYSHILFLPDLETVRRGIYCVVECEGMSMRRDVMKHMSAFFSQFLVHYPFIGKCHHYHTGTMVNVVSSVLRKILPSEELQDAFKVGLQFDGHMGDAFLIPTVEEANKRMLGQMEAALRRRYECERHFTLED